MERIQTTPPAETKASLSSVVGTLAHWIDSVIAPGDNAQLRRLDPDSPSGAAFWRLLADPLRESLPSADASWRDEAETRWACIIRSMAELRGLHRPRLPLGSALAEAGFAELRFLRLLRAKGSALHDVLRTTTHFLASRGTAVDFTDIAILVLSEGRSDEESIRRRLARNYYSIHKD